MINAELIVDNFAGGGGASTGIELATGRSVDIAINHDPEAIKMHKANHPSTKHYCESVWDVDPLEACNGHPVALAWFSPDCKHFSKAKGGKPKEKKIRGLAWVALRWAALVRPRVIMIENVEEFKTWGPLNRSHRPIKKKVGTTFAKFVNQLKGLGYVVEFKELVACDYGAPTKRKRFFMIARCDGKEIAWPEKTHGPGTSNKYVSAGSVINWNNLGSSIFGRKTPLKDKTMNRIWNGVLKFIQNSEEPYMLQEDKAAFLIQYHSETTANSVRGQSLHEPIMTIDGSPRYGLVTAFLVKYYGNMTVHSLENPIDTITTKDRFGLITVLGEDYMIKDINLRMLEPRELYNAQGFPNDYIIDKDYTGKQYPRTEQVKRCGNAVPPPFANALVMANMNELCIGERLPNMSIDDSKEQLRFA